LLKLLFKSVKNKYHFSSYGPRRTYAAYDDGTAWSHAPHDGNAPAMMGMMPMGPMGPMGVRPPMVNPPPQNEKLTGLCKMGFYYYVFENVFIFMRNLKIKYTTFMFAFFITSVV
jgi:hypothetical protein